MVHGEVKGIFDLRKLPALESAQYELELLGTLSETEHVSREAVHTSEEGGVSRFAFKERAHAEFALLAQSVKSQLELADSVARSSAYAE